MENLELRRLLSAASSYDLQTPTIYQEPARVDRAAFGSSLATNGNLALIGSPGLTSATNTGSARLIDTSTGQTLHVFNDPDQLSGDSFGTGVAFVGNKLAISAPTTYAGGTGRVYLYDSVTYAPAGTCFAPFAGSFGATLRALGNDLLVSITGSNQGQRGVIARYDTSSATLVTTYTNSLTSGDDFFGFQMAVQGGNVYAYANGLSGAAVYKLDPATSLTTLFAAGNVGDTSFGLAMEATATSLFVASPVDLAVYKYDTLGVRTQTYSAPTTSPTFGGAFAEGIALSGDALVVSGKDGLVTNPANQTQWPGGQVIVLDAITGNTVQIIDNPTPQYQDSYVDSNAGNFDAFGTQVAALPSGKFIATDPFDDDNDGSVEGSGPYDMGAAYIYAPHVSNQAPTASIAPVAPVNENSTVTLDGSGSSDPDGNADIVSYLWDLDNDGQYDDASGITTPFTQDLPGNYTVGLKVIDSVGHESTASQVVTFNDVAPTANAGGNQSGNEGTGVALHGTGNNSAGDAITGYAWDLDNNGTFETPGQDVSFNPDLPGNYTVNLRVTDDDGQTAVNSANITINNVAPTANAGGNQSGNEGTGVSLHGSGTTAPGDAIISYAWDLDNNGTFETSGQDVSFNPDLPASYTVKLQVTDDDGETAIDSAVITINDITPTANAGGNQTGNEGTGVSLHGSGTTAPGDAIVAYAWDLDNNGSFETSGQDVSFNPDLPGSYTVNLRVTDDDGETAVNSASITINDITPTANAGPNQTTTTNTQVNFSGSGTTAPGDAITTYAWDFNYDGTNFNTAATGANTSHTYSTAGNYTVALRVTDDDGESAISTCTVTVNNPPPSNTPPSNASIAGQSNAVRQQTITFTGSYTDPDSGDSHTIAWNFGDGNQVSGTALTFSHAYVTAGTFTVTMTVTDSANASTSANFLVNVTATGVQGGTYYAGGTSGADTVVLVKNSVGATVITLNGASSTFGGSHIVVLTGAGDDLIDASKTVNAALEIYGGTGNDVILGGGTGDILVGGDGNDAVSGNKGRDILIGGTGADTLTGDQDNDILIAGYTTHDNDSAALNNILATWNSGQTYDALVNSLRSTSLRPDVDVFDDAAVDQLKGGSGQDWFIFNNDQGVKDIVSDLKSGEIATDV